MKLMPDFSRCPVWNSIFGVPMDSESTARVIDQVDLSAFQSNRVFTPTNAQTLAALATMAYSDPADQKRHLDMQKGLRGFRFLTTADNEQLGIEAPDTGTQVSLVETEGALLVATRGTSPPWLANLGKENEAQWQDYLVDLACYPAWNYSHTGYVHGGFKEAADGIWEQLKPLLRAAQASHKAVHFCGHSLGAAIALHLADRSHEELGLLAQSVVRTGGPDVGWEEHARHLEEVGLGERTFNFMNHTDPIPLALPAGVTVGRNIYLNHRGEVDLRPGLHSWDRISGVFRGLAQGNVDPLYDHVPVFYNDKLADPANLKALEELQS